MNQKPNIGYLYQLYEVYKKLPFKATHYNPGSDIHNRVFDIIKEDGIINGIPHYIVSGPGASKVPLSNPPHRGWILPKYDDWKNQEVTDKTLDDLLADIKNRVALPIEKV